MPKRKWYVVTVGRDIGVFSTWLEVGPLVKGVPNAIHQSFLTRAEATRMFAEEQARGRTRIVDPDAVNSPQRARNYSEPSPFPPAMSSVGVTPIHGHHRSPLSVHPTTTSSRNRSTPSTILLSDRRAPIVSGTSNSSPATFTSNPRSALDISPSMRRFQVIQAALQQETASAPATPRGHVQVRTPLLSNTNITSNFRSLTPVPSSSNRNRALERAATASPDTFRNSSYAHGSGPASANRKRESASTSVGFDARAPPVSSGHPSHTNTCTYTKLNTTTTGGARTSNPTVAIKSTSEPSSSSRGLQRTLPLSPDTFHSTLGLAASDSRGRSSASPRAVVRTPHWLPPYPTARTPSPDSDSSPGPSDELLSPLSNVNLNSFALDNYTHRYSDTVEGNTLGASVDPSTQRSRSRRPNAQSQSSPIFGTPSTSTNSRSVSIQIDYGSDPRSPIISGNQIPEQTHTSALENSFARPSPRINNRPLSSSPLSNFSVNGGHGPSLLFRH